ncbi:SDR family oxidoreductase [Acidaminobacter sp. JC074]|uniref:SDR family oxidoreductase n=1 Tax=Acidaminobacter sp. JC074 TaxID=2530199 RepID=UPI001F0D4119|nr:SDR family oxidoreductase [Acidaminobacter sp. JC074]MCH4890989.1 SDR family oxidoreductase [Acidaminobacter sp. JC074]
MKKTIVITGASTGIGRATALYFAENDWQVAATMRSPDKETELQKIENINVYQLDVTNQTSIDKAYESISSDFEKIDALLNNAGYALYGPFEISTPEQIRKEFDVNVFGLMDVTRTFLPKFREQKEGLIMNISSMGGKITFPLISTYHSTKFAVEGFTEVLAYELEGLGIKAKLIEPGNIATDFGGRSMKFAASDVVTDYNPYVENMMAMMQAAGPDMYSQPEVVAEVIFKAATDGTDQIRYIAGEDAKQLISMRQENGDEAYVKHMKSQYAIKDNG